jgi:Uma2 family endonuclease
VYTYSLQQKGNTAMALSAEYPQFPRIDVEDYLTLDNTSKTARYEYLDGELRMLAGGSPDHAIIGNNISGMLYSGLRKRPCIVYSSDVRLHLSESCYVYPDVTVSCDSRDRGRKDNIQYPCLVVEVLSPSTQAIDRGEKLGYYLECPTLEEYILIGSQRKSVEIYHREEDSWRLRIYKPGSTIHLKSVNLEIAFDDIYEKTSLE